ncbi:proliferating cell nuclear antigen 2 [Prunus dulcis]|uniref:Proliferating cell nuclear antigen 2 n=1 Tax=Prunus dulcis TaxID=3755 RepID=A0A4Y1R0A8_PRUDU|nr:proliferating cell nuclear antigen 2 [Prunus dulcis]
MFTFPILKKPEQCIIEGDVGANPVSLVLDLCHASTILNASMMSKTPEQCIIEGDVGAAPVSLVLNLRHAKQS